MHVCMCNNASDTIMGTPYGNTTHAWLAVGAEVSAAHTDGHTHTHWASGSDIDTYRASDSDND